MTIGHVRAGADPVLVETAGRQALAASPAISVWASANAGAGKTKVLIDRIARLLLAGADPGRILAVTYTKAAAAEMQSRLFQVLGSWTIAHDGELSGALMRLDSALDVAAPGQLARARGLFARALETPGGLKIQTIHAFCQTVLQRFPLEAGIPPGFQVLEDLASAEVRERAFAHASAADPETFLRLARATSMQGDREAVFKAMGDGRALSMARAAGAEDVHRRLCVALGVPEDADPDAVRADAMAAVDESALRAAAEALDRLGGKTDKAKAVAIHQALAEPDLRRRFAMVWRIAHTDKGEPLDRLCAKSVKDHPAAIALFGAQHEWKAGGGIIGDVRAAEDHARAIALAANSAALTRAVLAVDARLSAIKTATGALDFDDLLARTRALLTAGPSAAQWVLFKLDQGLEHILIDEAQDTSPDQWELLTPLFAALEAGDPDRVRTRFVVGDDKQSIYSFQGAEPERFHLERKSFEQAGESLQDGRRSLGFELSFRTGQTILDAVDLVWATSQCGGSPQTGPDPDSDTLERKFALPQRHVAYRTGQGAVVEHWPLAWPEGGAGSKEDGEVEAWEHPLNVESEHSARNVLARRIAADIARRLAQREPVWSHDGQPRALEPGDIMILVRRRGPLFHSIIRALKAERVAVAGADRLKLVDDPGVQDLLALARFAVLPGDDFNTACVLKGAFCGLVDDDVHLFALAHDRGPDTLWKRLCDSANPAHAAPRALMAEVLERGGSLPAYEFFAALLEGVQPDGRTGWQCLIERLGREAREPVEAFLARALDHGRRGAPSLHAFLDAVAGDQADVKREMDQSAGGVRVMTVHGAKGLEAPVVILPDITADVAKSRDTVFLWPEASAFVWVPPGAEPAGPLPVLREQALARAAAEAWRLLYVAMTRARDRLILCGHASGNFKTGCPAQCWQETARAALQHLPGRRIEARPFGDIDIWGEPPPPVNGRRAEPATAPVIPEWVRSPAPDDGRRLRRVAPSALVPDGAEPPALSPLAPDAARRFVRGRLIHELLQRLPDLPPAARAAAASARLAREDSLSGEERDGLIREALAVLEDPAFAPLFGPDSRAEAAIAGRGPGLPADMVVNGSVDRLVVTPDEVLVLDFKTNRPPPREVAHVAEVYVAQMAAYRALLQAAWPGRRVRCALLWTDGPRLMELPDTALDAALRGIAGHPR